MWGTPQGLVTQAHVYSLTNSSDCFCRLLFYFFFLIVVSLGRAAFFLKKILTFS